MSNTDSESHVHMIISLMQSQSLSNHDQTVKDSKIIQQLFESLHNQKQLQDFLNRELPNSTKMIQQQFFKKLKLVKQQAYQVLYEKGQPNDQIYFLLKGQVQTFSSDGNSSSRVSESSHNLQSLLAGKKRLSAVKGWSQININEIFEKECQTKYGDPINSVDAGHPLQGPNPFFIQVKLFTAITTTNCWLLTLRKNDYMDLRNAHYQCQKDKKKFLFEVFGDCLTTYDQNTLGHMIPSINEITMDRGTILFQQGQVVDSFYIIQEGEIYAVEKLTFLDEFGESHQIDRSICILGKGQIVNEETILYNDTVNYTASAHSNQVILLEIKKEMFNQFPHNLKTRLQEQTKLKTVARNHSREQFRRSEYKTELVDAVQGAHRQHLNRKKKNIKDATNPNSSSQLNLMKFMNVHPNPQQELNQLFRNYINIKQSPHKKNQSQDFQTVDNLIMTISQFKPVGKHPQDDRKVELKQRRFDFGNGDLQKMEKQIHYFKVSKMRQSMSQRSLLSQDTILQQNWTKANSQKVKFQESDKQFEQSKSAFSMKSLAPNLKAKATRQKSCSSMNQSQTVPRKIPFYELQSEREETPQTAVNSVAPVQSRQDISTKQDFRLLFSRYSLGSVDRIHSPKKTISADAKSSEAVLFNNSIIDRVVPVSKASEVSVLRKYLQQMKLRKSKLAVSTYQRLIRSQI